MKKHLLLIISALIVLFAGCSDDKETITEKSYALFLQDTISISPLGGEAIALVEWYASEWEINMEGGNGFINRVSQQAGSFAAGKDYAKVKFSCNENNTEAIRTQDVLLLNKTTGDTSKLVLKQRFIDKSVLKGYCVSTAGSDAADGSRATPFLTIGKAASVAQPGDTIFVEGGTYIEHSIRPAESGIENAMIVFKPLSAADPVIIKHPATEFEDKTSIFDLTDRNYIRIEGFNFKDYKYDKASVYIKKGTGNVVINNRFENLGNNQVMEGDATCVVYVSGGAYNIIRNNYFKNIYGDGVGIKGATYNNLVSENTFIEFKGKPRGWSPTGSFSSNMNAEESLTDGGDNIFAFNYSEKGKFLVWFDRDGSRNIVLRNVARDGESLFFNESRCAQNIAQENIAFNMSSTGFETAQYETGYTTDARWINNVAYNNKRGFHIHKSERDECRNNISFNNREHNLIFTDIASTFPPHIFKNNLWFSASKPKSIKYKGTDVTVADFQRQIGEVNGLSADPLFVNPDGGDFRLRSDSPAKGAGDTGNDIGAYPVYPQINVGYVENQPLTGNLQVSFRATLSSAVRGETINLVLELNRATLQSVSIDLTPVAGDAQKDIDYSLESQTVTFNSGERTKTVAISFKGTAEHDQLVAFRLENVVNAQVGPKNMQIIKIKKN